MQLGTVLVPLVGGPPGPSRPFGQWIDDTEKMMSVKERAGFTFTAVTHAYQSAAGGGIQPLVLLSRLAPISGNLRLATQVLLLPLLNAMDVAYNVSTLDHITEGRLDFGVGLGYHPLELEPMGIRRSDRVPKFEETVQLMKKFWTGEPVHHRGRYFNVSGTQLGTVPVQNPHPPLWGGGQSQGAAARAGRILDGIVIGPQAPHADARDLLETFREEWRKVHAEEPPRVGAWRTFIIGDDPKDAVRKGIVGCHLTFNRYIEGKMLEKTTVKIATELEEDSAGEWAFLGNYGDCLEGLRRCRDELGLTHVTCQFYNLPEDRSARLEWVQGFGEEVISKL